MENFVKQVEMAYQDMVMQLALNRYWRRDALNRAWHCLLERDFAASKKFFVGYLQFLKLYPRIKKCIFELRRYLRHAKKSMS